MVKRLLVVDDEPDLQRTAVLRDEGFEVQADHHGGEVLVAVVQNLPDLILSNVWMPGLMKFQSLTIRAMKITALTGIL